MMRRGGPELGGQLDDLVGRLVGGSLGRELPGSVPSLAELLENSEFWAAGGETEEDAAIEEEMELLRVGGPGAVREKKMQDSVQTWLISKRAAALSGLHLRRLADNAGQGGRADALLEDSLRILQRKTDVTEGTTAVCELQALKIEMRDQQRALEEALRRASELEAALEDERARAGLLPAQPVGAEGRGAPVERVGAPAAHAVLNAGVLVDTQPATPKAAQEAREPAPEPPLAPPLPLPQQLPELLLLRPGYDAEPADPSGVEEARRIIADIRKSKLVDVVVPEHLAGAIEQMRATVGRAVDRLALDLYSTSCHFLDEIIQNCDDNRYELEEGGRPALDIVVAATNYGGKEDVWIFNNEVPCECLRAAVSGEAWAFFAVGRPASGQRICGLGCGEE